MNDFSQGFCWKKAILAGLPLLVLFGLGIWLRSGAMELRPMHADEAVQGMQTAELLESGHYAYNPKKFHGPSLYYLTLPVAWVRGEFTGEALSEVSLRMVPLICSLLLALVPLLFGRELGKAGVLTAVGFLLFSPGLVYYSTFYIQEMILAGSLAVFAACYWRMLSEANRIWSLGMGLSAGFAVASKETGILLILVILLSGWIAMGFPRLSRAELLKRREHFIYALIGLIVVAAPLFSSFGNNPGGLIDAFRGLYSYEPESGHDKPWWYYLSILTGWERGRVALGGEGLLFLSAMIGACLSFVLKSRSPGCLLARYVSITFGVLFVTFSVFSYKTPWALVTLLFPMCIMSGFTAKWIFERCRRSSLQPIAGVALAIVLSLTINESIWSSRSFPSDERNPYAYVHTSNDLLKLIEKTRSLASENPDVVVKVMAEEYWPIPWYLRDIKNVGYWNEMPEDPYSPVMIVSAEFSQQLDPDHMSAYASGFRGLRPGKIMLLYHLLPDLQEGVAVP